MLCVSPGFRHLQAFRAATSTPAEPQSGDGEQISRPAAAAAAAACQPSSASNILHPYIGHHPQPSTVTGLLFYRQLQRHTQKCHHQWWPFLADHSATYCSSRQPREQCRHLAERSSAAASAGVHRGHHSLWISDRPSATEAKPGFRHRSSHHPGSAVATHKVIAACQGEAALLCSH